MRARKPEILARRVNRYLKIQAEIREKYAASDALLDRILEEMKPGQTAGAGVLVDNFAEKNKVYRAHGLSRYEIKPIGAAGA